MYRKLHQDRWPSYEKAAELAFNKYAECLALNMPILPRTLVEEEMEILDRCRNILSDTSMTFARAMNISEYIVVPEECEGTEEEFMANLVEEMDKSVAYKAYMDNLSNKLFDKSSRSGDLIESLLQHHAN